MAKMVWDEQSYLNDLAARVGLPNEYLQRMVEEAPKLPKKSYKRQAPPGGITIRRVAKRYHMAPITISVWVSQGFIPVICETRNEKYVDEAKATEVIMKFKRYPGPGRRTIRKALGLA